MIDLNFDKDVVVVKLYNINGLNLIFGIGDGFVRFKEEEEESRERMSISVFQCCVR